MPHFPLHLFLFLLIHFRWCRGEEIRCQNILPQQMKGPAWNLQIKTNLRIITTQKTLSGDCQLNRDSSGKVTAVLCSVMPRQKQMDLFISNLYVKESISIIKSQKYRSCVRYFVSIFSSSLVLGNRPTETGKFFFIV